MLNLIMQTPAVQPSPFSGLFMFIPLALIFYFLLFRPQQKRIKDHKTMIDGLKRGDDVITNGGLMGKITKVGETDLTIEVAENVRVRVARSMIAAVPSAVKVAANDAAPAAKKSK